MAQKRSKSEKFDESHLLKELVNLKETHVAITTLSKWCMEHHKADFKIARCWLKVLKNVKSPDQKLNLLNLFNDIVQKAKTKQTKELHSRLKGVLKEAMPYLREEFIGSRVAKVERIVNIWQSRQVFEETFIDDIKKLLQDPKKDDQDILDNYQPQQLCTKLKIMKALEDDSEYKHKLLKDNDVNLIDVDGLKTSLKDRKHGNDFIEDFEQGRKKMTEYIKALEKEINKRKEVIDLLVQGSKYYDSLLSEVTIVADAYNNFGKRVANKKKKLEIKLLSAENESGSSPIPSPPTAFEAPSPTKDDEMELELPEDSHTMPIAINEPVVNPAHVPLPSGPQPSSSSSAATDKFSISEVLTKIAMGEQVDVDAFTGGAVANKSGPDHPGQFSVPPPTANPPAAHHGDWPRPHQEWPEPRPDPSHHPDYPQPMDDPVPEWKIQPEDDLPIHDNYGNFPPGPPPSQSLNGKGMEEDRSHHHSTGIQDRLRNLASMPAPSSGFGDQPRPPLPDPIPPPHMQRHTGPPRFDGPPPAHRPRMDNPPTRHYSPGSHHNRGGFRGRGPPRGGSRFAHGPPRGGQSWS